MLQRLLISFLIFLVVSGCSDMAPLSIEAMRAGDHSATLTFERSLESEGSGLY